MYKIRDPVKKTASKKRAKLAQLRGLKVDDIAIPETEVIIDAPEIKPMDRTEMNIDRNIATAKRSARDWDKDKVCIFSFDAVFLEGCKLLYKI